MKRLVAKSLNSFIADSFKNAIASSFANVYVLLAKSTPWTANDTFIDYPYDTVDYENGIVKNGIIVKKVNSSDVQSVVPRTDWESGTVYTAYDQTANLFLKAVDFAITSGNVNVTNALANTITTTNVSQLNLAFSTPSIGINDLVKIGNEVKEVVRINTAGDFIQVNSNFTTAYTSNTLYLVETSEYQYYNKFYVRNTYDQVFKCLFNNGNAASTIMPEITLGGELPENPYIETGDGYKWKYLYTISSGLKNKFFTNLYMPVTSDPLVVRNAENGRVDIVQILNGGNGYFSGLTTNNYSVVSVSGDGSGASFSVDVLNGVIKEVNILDGGTNYTNMSLAIQDPLKVPGSANANLRAVISPPNGHGYNPASELGSSQCMISVDFQGSLSGEYPIYNDGSTDYRQVAIIRNPRTTAGALASLPVYPLYTKITVAPLATFTPDSIVYVGNTYSTAVFSGTVVHFDSAENILYLNNLQGDIMQIEGKLITDKDNGSNSSQVFSYLLPDINILSGEILYVENREKISRSANQTETVKLVVEF